MKDLKQMKTNTRRRDWWSISPIPWTPYNAIPWVIHLLTNLHTIGYVSHTFPPRNMVANSKINLKILL